MTGHNDLLCNTDCVAYNGKDMVNSAELQKKRVSHDTLLLCGLEVVHGTDSISLDPRIFCMGLIPPALILG